MSVAFSGGDNAFDIDWGDGCKERVSGAVISHDYVKAGDYTIKISDEIKAFSTGYATMTASNLIDVMQWGTAWWDDLTSAFHSCSNMTMSATDAPNLSSANDLSFMFYKCTKFNTDINHWEVGGIKKMRSMFNQASSFNQPLDKWNTQRVVTMEYMFGGALSFNQPIGDWRLESINSMNYMLENTPEFLQNLDKWFEMFLEKKGKYPVSYQSLAFLFGTSTGIDDYLELYEKRMSLKEKDLVADILT